MTVIQILDRTDLDATDTPVYLKDADPDGRGGRGSATFTPDLAQAKRFADVGAAIECWKAQSTKVPTRPDGKPNRPLTAYSITFVTVPE